jgi:hypothetical protein
MSTNYLLKHAIERRIEGRIIAKEEEEEDISSYWITLSRRGYAGNEKRKALAGTHLEKLL